MSGLIMNYNKRPNSIQELQGLLFNSQIHTVLAEDINNKTSIRTAPRNSVPAINEDNAHSSQIKPTTILIGAIVIIAILVLLGLRQNQILENKKSHLSAEIEWPF
jgi:hypothetical protein